MAASSAADVFGTDAVGRGEKGLAADQGAGAAAFGLGGESRFAEEKGARGGEIGGLEAVDDAWRAPRFGVDRGGSEGEA